MESLVRKQCKPWSDATLCGVWSGSALIAYGLLCGFQGKNGVTPNLLICGMDFSHCVSQAIKLVESNVFDLYACQESVWTNIQVTLWYFLDQSFFTNCYSNDMFDSIFVTHFQMFCTRLGTCIMIPQNCGNMLRIITTMEDVTKRLSE